MILHITPSTGCARFPPENYGGVEDHIYEVSRRLCKKEAVAVLDGSCENAAPSREAVEGFSVYRIPTRFLPTIFRRSTFNFPIDQTSYAAISARLLSASEKIGARIVHLHESHTQFLNAIADKRPKVFTFHGSHTCVPYHKQTFHAKLLAWKFDGFSAKRCDHLIAISRISARNIRAYLGCPPDKISIIPHGINTENFRIMGADKEISKELNCQDRPVLISIARIAQDKGLDLSLEAAALLKGRFPDILLIFCGISNKELAFHPYGMHILSLVKKYGLQKNVAFIGRVSRKDLPRYISISDVFLHPARVEAFGLVVGEAMACGKPAVCLEGSGGPDDMIVDGANGFLCKKENPQDIAEKVQFLLDSPRTRDSFGKKARQTIIKEFSWETCVEKIQGVYDAL